MDLSLRSGRTLTLHRVDKEEEGRELPVSYVTLMGSEKKGNQNQTVTINTPLPTPPATTTPFQYSPVTPCTSPAPQDNEEPQNLVVREMLRQRQTAPAGAGANVPERSQRQRQPKRKLAIPSTSTVSSIEVESEFDLESSPSSVFSSPEVINIDFDSIMARAGKFIDFQMLEQDPNYERDVVRTFVRKIRRSREREMRFESARLRAEGKRKNSNGNRTILKGKKLFPAPPKKRYAEYYLYSIGPLPLMEKGGPGKEATEEYEELIGHPVRTLRGEVEEDAYDDIIRLAWNFSFHTTFCAKETDFYLILSKKDVESYQSLQSGERKKHLIFYKGDAPFLLEAAGILINYEIDSVAFVRCHMGEVADTRAFLGAWIMLSNSTVALSFSRCIFPSDLHPAGFEDLFFRFASKKIVRMEVETMCGNNFGAKFFEVLQDVVAVSHRHYCDCDNKAKCRSVGQNQTPICERESKSLSNSIAGLIFRKAKILEEVEFDMTSMSEYALVSALSSLGSEKLKTFSLNLKKEWKGVVEEEHWKLFKSAKNLEYLEVKGSPLYFKEGKLNLCKMLGPLKDQLKGLRLEGIVPQRLGKVRLGKSFYWFPLLEELDIVNCDFFDQDEALEKFLSISYQRDRKGRNWNGSVRDVGFRGLGCLKWTILDDLVRSLPLLTRLDISGMNRQFLPNMIEERYSYRTHGTKHPVQLIFFYLRKLQDLAMDDLEIGDQVLFGGMGERKAEEWDDGRREEEIGNRDQVSEPSLVLLQDLRKLSLQNTNVSNISVRCIGRYLPKLTFLNVSFTHANINGIRKAGRKNPDLEIVATGCGLTLDEKCEFAVPRERLE